MDGGNDYHEKQSHQTQNRDRCNQDICNRLICKNVCISASILSFSASYLSILSISLNSNLAKAAMIKKYTLPKNGTLTITDLPPTYILTTFRSSGDSFGVVVGVGYGATQSRHKVNILLQPSSVTFTQADNAYGLVCTSTNTGDIAVYVTALSLE